MSFWSKVIDLFLTDMETDGDDYFDFDRDLNDNFKKIDKRFEGSEIKLSGDNWEGGEAPYSQSVEVEGIKEKDNPHITLKLSEDYETAQSEMSAYSRLFKAITTEGKITFYATNPTGIELNLILKLL